MRLFTGSTLMRRDRPGNVDLEMFNYSGLHQSKEEAVGAMLAEAVSRLPGYSINSPNAWPVDDALILAAADAIRAKGPCPMITEMESPHDR